MPIPAGSELAIEGWLRPDLMRDEVPFGERTGYYSGTRRPCLAGLIAMHHLSRTEPIDAIRPLRA
jgi:4-hydroxy-3-polyprenylbenzoate decarboxylase